MNTITKKFRKLTIVESRAQEFCNRLSEKKFVVDLLVHVEWKKSSMYGFNPVVTHNGQKLTNVSGCGYDKLSTVLADLLCFLFPVGSPEFDKVGRLGGFGEGSFMDNFNKIASGSFNIQKIGNGKNYDSYLVKKI